MDKVNDITTKNYSSRLGSAAGRKRGRILSDVMFTNSLAFITNNHHDTSSNVLDIFCGEGKITYDLAQITGLDKTTLGCDPDPTSIEIAKEKFASDQLNFTTLKNDNWVKGDFYDLIYCRTFLNTVYNPSDLLQKIYFCLKHGGMVLIEHFDISKFQCFPQSYAFDRALELQVTLDRSKKTRIESIKHLEVILKKAHFENIQIQQVSPSFLPEESKHIGSLSLEDISAQLIDKDLTGQTELQALLFELKAYENHEKIMVSLPTTFQVKGYK